MWRVAANILTCRSRQGVVLRHAMKYNTASDTCEPLLVIHIPHKTEQFLSSWATASFSNFTEPRHINRILLKEVGVITPVTSCRQCLSSSAIGVSWLRLGRPRSRGMTGLLLGPLDVGNTLHTLPDLTQLLRHGRWGAGRNWVQVLWSNMYVYKLNIMYVYSRESSWNANCNALESDRPQRYRPVGNIIALQYPSSYT
jgi:hypothetical protein